MNNSLSDKLTSITSKLKNRNAIRILQLNGYPEEIIKEAIALSKQMDEVKIN